MWRIMIRAIRGIVVADEREEGEYDEEEEEENARIAAEEKAKDK
jgi:hypothetical protein